MRWLVLLLGALLVAGDAGQRFVFVESLATRAASSGDRAVTERLRAQLSARLSAARRELTTAPPSLAAIIRADIAAFEAELERLALATGGELAVARQTLLIAADRFTLSGDDGVSLIVDRQTGQGYRIGPGAETLPIALAAPAQPLPAQQGREGPLLLGRPTRRFELSLDGRDFTACIDPELPNAFAWLLPAGGDASALARALARLPGLPLQITCEHEGLIRRLQCIAIE
ncbi:MAG: hypothetical protein RMM29_00140 [Planctomycetota bacterium]|nr:hypothetical protein [Planctomycetota bacterium]MCX8039278.1 hypothetical protein [Planctomycetota bacterium]MDW8372043.1 hypothetical protein [Planctomycetota bacterium]